MNDIRDGKWGRSPLKSSWYDDHFGASRVEVVENRLRAMAERFRPNDEERIASEDVERFFDRFESKGDH